MSFQNNILQLHTNYNFTDYNEFYTSFLKLTWHITANVAAIINIIINTTIIAWEIQQRNGFGYFNYLAYLIHGIIYKSLHQPSWVHFKKTSGAFDINVVQKNISKASETMSKNWKENQLIWSI